MKRSVMADSIRNTALVKPPEPSPVMDMTPDRDKRVAVPVAKTRKGRKGVVVYISKDAHRALADICVQEEKTKQQVMMEAVNHILRSHGKTPCA